VGTVPTLRFAVWCALGLVTLSSPLMAQDAQGRILVDRAAPGDQRPMVVEAPSGAPLINIATPSSAGVSRNRYSQFDVGTQGAILNNSRSGADTVLGGQVLGNPNLATGPAKVILNEVNGPASQLNGYVEVGGNRAAVVIANPAGIQANGAGFINASRVTLTTGTPVFNGASLEGYRVGNGAIRVDGAGLDTTAADYTDLISRSLELNGRVWAQQLQATLGTNTVSADHTQVAAGAPDGAAPQFALDSSALGGMYANKITLLGTEQGVGVRNAGVIGAQAGEVTVTVDGRLENTGKLQAQTNTRIDTNSGVANAGLISAGREAVIHTGADVDNSGGTLNAQRIEVDAAALANRGGTIEQTGLQGIALNANAVTNRDGGRIGLAEVAADGGSTGGDAGTEGSSADGGVTTGGTDDSPAGGETVVLPLPEVLADGVLNIAGTLNNGAGKINAGGGVQLNTATGIDNSGGHLGLGQLSINQGDLFNDGGELTVTGDARIHAGRIGNDAGRFEVGGALDLDAQTLSNRAGTISHSGAADARVHAGTFDNTEGSLVTNANALDVSGDVIVNERGRIEHAGAGGLTLAAGTLHGASGAIVTNGAASVTLGNADHRGATLSATQVTLNAGNIDNRGGTMVATGAGANMLDVTGALDNGDAGTIASNGDLTIKAATLSNATGTVQQAGTGTLSIDAATLEGTAGTIASNGALSITGNTTNLRDGTTVAQRVAIDTGSLTTAGGSLVSIGADALTITARDAHDNTAGSIATNGNLQLDAGSLTNTDGTISASGTGASTVAVRNTLDNTRGTLATSGELDLQAGTLINRDTRPAAGETASTGIHASTLNVRAATVDNANGQMSAADSLTLDTNALDNSGGSLTAANALTLHAASLSGAAGTIGTNGALELTGDTLDLGDGSTFAESIKVDVGTLRTAGGTLSATGTGALSIDARDGVDNTAGTIATNGVVQIDVGSLTNTDGTISAAGSDASRIAVGTTLDNTRGLIATSGALDVRAATLINRDTAAPDATTAARGIAAQTLTLQANVVDNANGQVGAADSATVKAGQLDNTAGAMTAGQSLSVDAQQLNGQGGTIGTNGALTLTGSTLDLRDGTTFAQHVQIDADALTTAGGTLIASGTDPLSINARSSLDNTGGTISTNGALDVNVGTETIDACDGLLIAHGSACGALINNGGTISASGTDASTIAASGLVDNTGGLIAGSGALTINTAVLVNRDTLSADPAVSRGVQAGTLSIDARQLDNASGRIAANDAATLTSRMLDNTAGTITAVNALDVNATTLIGTGGTLGSNGALTLTGETTYLRDATTIAQQITVDTGALTTAGGKLIASGAEALRIGARGAFDNTGGIVATNGALQVGAGTLDNTDGTIQSSGSGNSDLRIAGTLDNTRGTVATMGGTTVSTGDLINVDGTLKSASDDTLTLDANGHLDNTGGTLVANGAIALAARSLTNAGGVVQTRQGLTANVAGTLDNSDGLMVARGDVTATAGTLFNRDTLVPDATEPTGLFGQRVTLNTDALDNTRGQIVANDALTLRGNTQSGSAVTNAGGTLDGVGAVSVNATSFDNSGGQLVQRGADGALALDASGTLVNANGLIGAQGSGSVHAGAIDNGAGTVFGHHGLSLASEGDLRNVGGAIRAGISDDPDTDTDETVWARLAVQAGGALDNTDGVVDATGSAAIAAQRADNLRGQVLAGSTENDTLTVAATALNNQGGVLGTRAGDVVLNVADVDNRNGGRLVSNRDLAFNSNAVDNSGGIVFANRDVNYTNAGARLTNAGGQFGAGQNARLTLANIGNTNGGVIQAGAVWLNTPGLDLSGNGEVVGNVVHAQLATLTGDGRLYGTQWLDADFNGDYTYGTGPSLESDGLLDIAVAGAFTNVGTLQTPGELALSATSVINRGAINASNADGNGYAHITAGSIENLRGASIEGDWLELNADVVNNIGDLAGDNVTITADTLTNGQDLGTALAAVNYGEGFIGASKYLDIRANHLANLDGDIFSGGNLDIGGRDARRAVDVANISGRIQAEGNAWIAADTIRNERRMLAVEAYTLSPEEAYALSSQRDFDEKYAALSSADRADYDRIAGSPKGAATAADKVRLAEILEKLGWVRVLSLTKPMYDAANAELNRIAIAEYGARSSWMTENPSAFVRQNDSYTTGERLDETKTSAESQIIAGGDLTLDSGVLVRNYASRIAAGGNLTIAGTAFDADSADPRIENLAVAGQYTGSRATTAWIFEPSVRTIYTNGSGQHSTTAEFAATMTEDLVSTGPNVADASITANGGVSIEAGDVTNSAVTAAARPGDISGGDLKDAGSASLGSVTGATANAATGVGNAQGSAVSGQGGPGSAQGRTVAGGATSGSARGGTAGPSIGPSGAAAQFIGTLDRPLPNLVAEDNGMFDVNTDPNAKFLVTTAPRFAKGGPWESSDYLLNALRTDPNNIHKRLGDGYYEQRLVMEQIFQLTGRRSLNSDGDAYAQYRNLMDNAVSVAERLGLQLGAPLTSAQIASLDCDIVWLVEQVVNGEKVLVPVVYLSKATADRMAAEGALIDGDKLSINSSGTIRNDGTLTGNKGAFLSADTLINNGRIDGGAFTGITTRGDTVNTGRIEGNAIAIDAGGSVINSVTFDGMNAKPGVINAGAGGLQVDAKMDVINQGQIASAGHAVVTAGRDFVQNAATTNAAAGVVSAPAGSLTAGGSAVVTTGRDVVLDQSDLSAGQHVVIDAGRDAHFTAANVTAGGSMAVTAGRDIVSDTVTDTHTTYDRETVKEGKKKTTTTTTTTDETLRGSTFTANGDIAMVAKDGNIDLTAANVRSADGGVALVAQNGDVNLRAGYETDTLTQDSESKKNNTLSTTKTKSHLEVTDTTAVGTTISGKTVGISAENILVHGSTVVSDEGTTMVAKNNISVVAAENTHTESSSSSKTKSGVFSDGGTGFTIGKNKQSETTDLREVTHTGSVVGSVDGRVDIYAGGHYQQTGSDVIGMQGVSISGSTVTIENAEDTLDVKQTQKTSSGGIHVSVKGGAASAATSAYQSVKRAGEVEDDRLSALYAAQAAQSLAHAGDVGGQIANAQDVIDGNTKANAGGMSLRVGIGGSTTKAESEYHETTSHGSKVYSGNGDVTVVARDGDMNVIGSTIEGINTTVIAAGDLNLRSATETTSLRESNSAKSGEVGFTAGSEAGLGVYVSASGAKGKGAGDSTTYAETAIGGNRGTTTFASGGNTLAEGAQIIGDKVVGHVEGDFTVISQQDTDNYQTKNTSAGVDAAIGTGGGQISGYVNQSKVNSEYASVEKQAGIQAGPGGVDLYVGGHMQLDGGAIASTADPSKNRIDVGSLGFSDIENRAKYDASNVGVSGGGGTTGGNFNNAGGSYNTTGDSASSVTKAGIADGTLTVRDGSGQGIARGLTDLQQEGLKPIFDANKVAETLEMQQVAAQVGFTAAGDISVAMYDRARQDAANATNDEDRAAALARMESWSEGGTNKTILHGMTGAAVAALGGGDVAGGALGAAAAEKAKGAMGQYLTDHGVEYGSTEYEALMAAGSAALGSVGGATGTGVALAGDMYNRQLHASEEKIIADLVSQGYDEEEVRAVACAMVQCLLGRNLVKPGTLADGLVGDFELTPAGQDLSNRYQALLNQMSPAEQAAIAQRLSSTGEFRYTAANAMADAARDVQMGTRLDGLGQSVMGAVGSWASSILCPATGIACAGVAEGSDNFGAGLNTFYNGRPTLTMQNQAWQAAGLTPAQANNAEALVGLGIAGGTAASINRQFAAQAKPAVPASDANGAGRTETPNNLLPDNIQGNGLAPHPLQVDTKIRNQLADRGWSDQDMQAAISRGPVGQTSDRRSPAKTPDGLGRSDSASVYGSPSGYIVVNDRTGEVVQISDRNNPNWVPDGRIQWTGK